MRVLVLSNRTLTTLVCLLFSCSAIVLLADESTNTSTTPPSPEAAEFFESKIRPLLLQRCVECHNDEEPESGLSLESHAGLLRGGKLGPAIVLGKPKESLLISAINHDEFLKMPPKEKLSTAELVLLGKWISMGAPWPLSPTGAANRQDTSTVKPGTESEQVEFTPEQKSFWAYQPLHWPDLPKITSSDWIRSPIDTFVLEKLQAKGLAPAPPTSKRDLIRRATYDLIGLPPTEEEIDRFLKDSSANAFLAVIDRLLASPRYGERWGRHWLDVARFADSNGLDENIAYANAYRYRDYVISSLNSDKPYDRFVQEQIAGDLLGPAGNERAPLEDPFERFVATGFLAIGAKMLAEDDPVKMQMDIIDEQLSTLCQAFMGITVGCARCHDHKFDPIPTSDYYALAGIFKSTQTMENHKVVAKWFERPLVSQSEIESIRAIDREIESAKAAIEKLNKECRQRVAMEIQQTVAGALMATIQYEKFAALAKDKLARGLMQTDGAYPVNSGYALIEAEGFQRGTVARDSDNYGKEIGVIISHGASYAEYDLQVEHAGRYALEVRYAAAVRRPIRLLVDDVEINPSIAEQATGSWQPDSQTWFVEATLDLTSGHHKLKFDSKRVFPHIDKFALVFQSNTAWPYGTEPVALSRAGMDLGISYPVLALWRNYLERMRKKENDESNGESFFALWLRLREMQGDFDMTARQILSEFQSDSPLAKQTPVPLRDELIKAQPMSLKQVAEAYQVATRQILSIDNSSNDELAKLRQELLRKDSPLSGPENEIENFRNVAEQAEAKKLEAALADIERRRPDPPMAMGVTESQPEDLKIHLRGSHLVLGKLAKRRFPQVLTGSSQVPIQPSASGRLEFARWMTRPDHPLTSRVMVNRVWHWHFGRGLVPSVDNFGFLGQKPTHPKLLDWLASRFVADAWSLKELHRTIMLSQTYQMSTQFFAEASRIDPENELLWRFRRRRMTGEETRDSILAVGAGLDQKMYGTLMNVGNHKYVNSTDSATALNYANGRRSVYLPVIRSGVFDVLQTLDFPDPAMINGDRPTSTVAPQALLMMNSDLVYDQTQLIAEQLLDASMDDAQRISTAYRRILKRPPTIDEIAAAATFLRDARKIDQPKSQDRNPATRPSNDKQAWQSLCRVLISSNEFSYIE